MRAAVFDRYGPPEVLRIAELSDPVPGPGEARIRVRAAGVQPFDVAVREGRLRPGPVHFPHQVGQEFSGVVELLGEGVTGPGPGAAVLGGGEQNGDADRTCRGKGHDLGPAQRNEHAEHGDTDGRRDDEPGKDPGGLQSRQRTALSGGSLAPRRRRG